ncbi:phosphonate transport system ATP-binding protein [Rhodoglobus vestalii]|uniref:Phosphonate transport system ATP-binding protein n=1 Tax=Rhodoglobus vestalii TaxID=193384 RepID=A0A8H2KCU7_9MICO|nr:phosphonate ABC transporter ATP-binding protein [Rhodoglobus vestalii]TQO20836.1 phosphonate transport system ATP-binding protein [Rhodoglobus vestalii]
MIRFTDVSVRYANGVLGLDGINLEIPDGQFVVVVGLSGAGKSTLVRSINALVPTTSGELMVSGQRVDGASKRSLRELRSRVGMIFQSFNLVTRTTVLKNVLVGRLHATPTLLSIFGIYRPADVELAFEALERVGIVEKAYTRASQLSGGQQQRVAIARVLAQQPNVILADEPVASLDPPTANMVMRDLQRINRDLGITTVVNLHFLDLARGYAERIIGMREGRIVFDGPPDEADDEVFAQIYGRSLTADDILPTGQDVSNREGVDGTGDEELS